MAGRKFNGCTSPSLSTSSPRPTSRTQPTRHRISVAGNNINSRDAYGTRQVHNPRDLDYIVNGQRSTKYNMSNNFNWKELPQVEVKLTGVPGHFTTWEVYRLVGAFGNIVKISLSEGDKYKSRRIAFVKFQPPPNAAFWEVEGALDSIVASLSDQNKSTAVQDPSNKGALFPQHMVHYACSIEFGIMISENQMMSMYSSGSQDLEFALDLHKKTIDINFRVKVSAKDDILDLGYYRLQLKLDKLSVVFFEKEADSEYLIIPLDAPPELYRKPARISSIHHKGSRYWLEWDTLIRQTDVVLDEQQLRRQPGGLRRHSAIIDIGRWTTYRLAFRKSKDSNGALERIRRVLLCYNVQVRHQTVEVVPRTDTEVWDLLDFSGSTATQDSTDYSMQLQEMAQEIFYLSFETRYQLEVCVTHGYLHENNFTTEFLRTLHQLDQSERSQAIGILERVAVLKRRFFDPMEIFKLQVSFTEVTATRKPPRHCTIARSATVTPTMIYFNSPVVEISNRVIRGLSAQSDRFLRVRFSDELSWGGILSLDSQRNDEIYNRIRQILRSGIVLGERKYEFLAFGNSQFRERGAYFFAPTKELTCTYIRTQLGQMSDTDRMLPAKFCARLGQNFSTTRGLSVPVTIRTYKHNSKALVLPDVKRGGFIFTDGVGKISSFLAKMIAAEFKLPTEDAPAAFQFRLGGCKGVLAVDPALSSHEVYIRPSQYKFAAIQHGLEIVRTSSYASATLNRQIILVLSALGVSDAVFLKKMKTQLKALELALSDENVALNELQKAVDGNQVTLAMAGMIQNSFMATKEPFMLSLLKLWRSWTLKYLKEKAKVSIEQGVFLLGTVDETATLRGHFNDNQPSENDTLEQRIAKLPEVFCYVDWKRRGVYEAVQGVCILARNPSLHPGDIRVVRAIDVPHLHYLPNVVVFPQTGDRDISNMCSGGDLDGDDYLLIWDEELIPQEWNHPPMDFTAARPRALGREVTVDDMTDFFVDYMKSDKLALIATTHLALADWAEAGVKDDRCKELAQLHSLAVDYPKSGVPVTIPKHLKRVKWPHFMEKRITGYISGKVLGQLYDLVAKEDFCPEYSSPFDQKIVEAFTHSEELLNKVEAIKCRYDSCIKKIMAQHDIATEFEVWSAFVMKHNNEKKDYNFVEELGALMEAVRISFRDECEKEAGGRDPEHLHPFVSAMYTVTSRQVREALKRVEVVPGAIANSNNMPLMSFPWLFMQDLGEITSCGTQRQGSVHRIQGARRRHRTQKAFVEGGGQGGIETTEGIVPRGEYFIAFGDEQVLSQQTAAPDRGMSEVDEHIAMIEKSIRGQLPDRTETRRDIKLKSLGGYHETGSNAHLVESSPYGDYDDQINDTYDIVNSDHDNILLDSHQGFLDQSGKAMVPANNVHPPCGNGQARTDLDISPQVRSGGMGGVVRVELDLDNSDDD